MAGGAAPLSLHATCALCAAAATLWSLELATSCLHSTDVRSSLACVLLAGASRSARAARSADDRPGVRAVGGAARQLGGRDSCITGFVLASGSRDCINPETSVSLARLPRRGRRSTPKAGRQAPRRALPAGRSRCARWGGISKTPCRGWICDQWPIAAGDWQSCLMSTQIFHSVLCTWWTCASAVRVHC